MCICVYMVCGHVGVPVFCIDVHKKQFYKKKIQVVIK